MICCVKRSPNIGGDEFKSLQCQQLLTGPSEILFSWPQEINKSGLPQKKKQNTKGRTDNQFKGLKDPSNRQRTFSLQKATQIDVGATKMDNSCHRGTPTVICWHSTIAALTFDNRWRCYKTSSGWMARKLWTKHAREIYAKSFPRLATNPSHEILDGFSLEWVPMYRKSKSTFLLVTLDVELE